MVIVSKQMSMRFVFNLTLFLFAFFTFDDTSFALSNYQIKRICKKEKIQSICIKNLQQKKSNLQKGNLIEIPVIPYKIKVR